MYYSISNISFVNELYLVKYVFVHHKYTATVAFLELKKFLFKSDDLITKINFN